MNSYVLYAAGMRSVLYFTDERPCNSGVLLFYFNPFIETQELYSMLVMHSLQFLTGDEIS